MVDKPISGDAEQREWQTRVSREQSGLPPEPPEQGQTREGDADGQQGGDTDQGTDPG